MILEVKHASEFERCPRLPGLRKSFEPEKYPVREATKLFFERGLRSIFIGEPPGATVWGFTDEAAGRGYLYGKGEPYTIAQDFACWLDGTLRLVIEGGIDREPLRLYQLGEHCLHVDGWTDTEGRIHLYRAVSRLGDQALRWPELAVLAFEPEKEVFIHQYCLPQTRGGRLLSPLSIGYKHPKIENNPIRLARLDLDGKEQNFKNTWKKIGRWECPDIPWAEWRQGIDKDQCLDMIEETYSPPMLDAEQAYAVKGDLEKMAVVMEKPASWPRYREACPGCFYQGLCHGDRDSRKTYIPLKADESD